MKDKKLESVLKQIYEASKISTSGDSIHERAVNALNRVQRICVDVCPSVKVSTDMDEDGYSQDRGF